MHSPPLTANEAQCAAVSADAHAVSMLEHGPCSPRTKHSRPAATETLSPVIAYEEARALSG